MVRPVNSATLILSYSFILIHLTYYYTYSFKGYYHATETQNPSSLGGLEPPTFRLTAERANRLRHRDCFSTKGAWLTFSSPTHLHFLVLKLELFNTGILYLCIVLNHVSLTILAHNLEQKHYPGWEQPSLLNFSTTDVGGGGGGGFNFQAFLTCL